jgi:hypothetical protein
VGDANDVGAIDERDRAPTPEVAVIARDEADRTRRTLWTGSPYGRKLTVERRTEPAVGWRHWSLDGDLLAQLPGIGWEGPLITTDPDQPTYRRLFSEDKLTARIPIAIESFKHPGSGIALHAVMGRLDSFGVVIEHDFGWCAERAVIRELWITPWAKSTSEDLRRALEARYDCPVGRLTHEEYEERLGEYAPGFLGDPIRELHIEPRDGPRPSSPV